MRGVVLSCRRWDTLKANAFLCRARSLLFALQVVVWPGAIVGTQKLERGSGTKLNTLVSKCEQIQNS